MHIAIPPVRRRLMRGPVHHVGTPAIARSQLNGHERHYPSHETAMRTILSSEVSGARGRSTVTGRRGEVQVAPRFLRGLGRGRSAAALSQKVSDAAGVSRDCRRLSSREDYD